MKSDYIIDFERINELTTHPGDNRDKDSFMPTSVYSISKQIIKDYIRIWSEQEFRSSNTTDIKLQEVIDTLVYNKILIAKSTIRDKKINQILE